MTDCVRPPPPSGYVIACALMRSFEAMSVARAVTTFAEGRVPGIYKHGAFSPYPSPVPPSFPPSCSPSHLPPHYSVPSPLPCPAHRLLGGYLQVSS